MSCRAKPVLEFEVAVVTGNVGADCSSVDGH